MKWEVVIGLEIHTQLSTKSKLFSGAAVGFGAKPNTQTTLVDLGMPGALPVFNKEALRMAVMFGHAINAKIGMKSVFVRKNYFYPDLPKGYQTSQMDQPIVGKGYLDITLEDGTTSRVGIIRAHLEEDTGKSFHENFQGMTGIDLNRSSTPLLEIVSEPDIRSAKEAVAYVKMVHSIVTCLGICDGNMAEGSMRCDINLSLRTKSQKEYGIRTEIKNVNSFRFIEKAIYTEIKRQSKILEDGGRIIQETRLYDPEKNETRSMRSKEETNDYCYFPCPDLLPVILTQEYVDGIKATLPELPIQRSTRFQNEHGLSKYDANILSSSHTMADFFEKANALAKDSKLTANWTTGELRRLLNQFQIEVTDSPISANAFGELLLRIKDNTINNKTAKKVLQAMWNGEGLADQIIEAKNLKQVTNTETIKVIVQTILNANTKQITQYRSADENKQKKMISFFVGQVMNASQGKANPGMVKPILMKMLKG